MNTTELYLIAMLLVFSVPWFVWRVARTDYWAPLVVVQILTGILLGPGLLGAVFPEYYRFVFTPQVIGALNGVAWWAVMLFVFIAGVELDLSAAWEHKRESGITAGLALGAPLLLGCGAAWAMMAWPGWIGPAGAPWQFVLGVGMSCAVTALPILILLWKRWPSCACPSASASCATQASTTSPSGACWRWCCWTGSAWASRWLFWSRLAWPACSFAR
jgi:Kef-type K+ transport system membrane component KefB